MPFNEVKTLCAQFQGRVATPMNAEENRALKDLVTEEAFLGITDQETEGKFVDLTGKGVTYQNWNDGEPNNASPGEHCVTLLSDGTWNDIACSASFLTVCEFSLWGSMSLKSSCSFTHLMGPQPGLEDKSMSISHTQYWVALLWGNRDNKNGLRMMRCGTEKREETYSGVRVSGSDPVTNNNHFRNNKIMVVIVATAVIVGVLITYFKMFTMSQTLHVRLYIKYLI